MTTRELLAEYAILLNKYGPNSNEANQHLEDYRFNCEFYELAILSRKLKVALNSPQPNHVYN